MKKTTVSLIFFSGFAIGYGLISSGGVLAQDQTDKEDQLHQQIETMLTTPDLVTPDGIYVAKEMRALYYQNRKVIRLLEDIKKILEKQEILQKQTEKKAIEIKR